MKYFVKNQNDFLMFPQKHKNLFLSSFGPEIEHFPFMTNIEFFPTPIDPM